MTRGVETADRVEQSDVVNGEEHNCLYKFFILKDLLNFMTISCLFSCLISVSCTDLDVPCFVVVDLYFFYNYTHKLGGYEAVSSLLHSGYNK